MKRMSIVTFVAVLLLGAAIGQAQEFPQLPGPEKEHEWLAQLPGEWEADFEMYMEPGKPPLKAKGSEAIRAIGGFWTVSDLKCSMMGMPFNGVMTLGYNPEKKKYVGTWVDSMSSHHWNYEGTLDSGGKVLTLETKGPCPKRPGELTNFKEIIELKDQDSRTFTMKMQEPDGTWVTGMVANYRRKK